ncbi:TIGR02678 family protein [Enterococcus sp. LJL51]|uniref:TIGR02678 family protein n=1 Tax=Enterococcus sp. LJL51 TaxID=3416656 RepID=UPI003CEB1A18
MKPEEFGLAVKLLVENFWIIREDQPENYNFLRRHQQYIQREFRSRFGLSITIRPQYIQLLKRPFELEAWMGNNEFSAPMDFSLFCCGMAFVEELEVEAPFMMEELIQTIQLMVPVELVVDWNNYNHRKSLVRAVKKMERLRMIKKIEGDVSAFEQSEQNLEILFTTTPMARAFLARAPQSYTQYETFDAFKEDFEQSRSSLERNQVIYQRLLMTPQIRRTPENEDIFALMRNFYRFTQDYVEINTPFHFELYRDYAAFTLEQRDNWQELFPSRQVIDEILIQLATILRQDELEVTAYGEIHLTENQWHKLVKELQVNYSDYWSKEFKELSLNQLSTALLVRGSYWKLIESAGSKIIIQAAFGRLVAEMRKENGE